MHSQFGNRARAAARPSAFAKSPGGIFAPAHAIGKWRLQVVGPDGKIQDEREWENLVTTEGKNYLLATGLDNSASQITAWYVLPISGTPTAAAGDTMASHAGWTEVTAYSQSTRVAWTGGTVASGSVDNSGSVAAFTINADGTTVGGAALASVSTKSGTTGTLYAVGAFSGGNLTLSNGSTLNITATFSL